MNASSSYTGQGTSIFFWSQSLDTNSQNIITKDRIAQNENEDRAMIAQTISELSYLMPIWKTEGLELFENKGRFLFSVDGEDKDSHGRSSIILCGGDTSSLKRIDFTRMIVDEFKWFTTTFHRSISPNNLNAIQSAAAFLRDRKLERSKKASSLVFAIILLALLIGLAAALRFKS